MPNQYSLPKNIAALTPAWLTPVLQECGAIERATVIATQVEPIGLFSSELLRLRLEYDFIEKGAPTSLIVKQPLPDAHVRPGMGFTNEIYFYHNVADRLTVRTPKLYSANMGDRTVEPLLLLEEVNDIESIDWELGVTAAHAQQAFEALSQFHAAWWGQTETLHGLCRLSDPNFRNQIAEAYERGWHYSRDYFRETHNQAFLTIGDALVGRVTETLVSLGTPATLLHGDAHFENLPIVKDIDGDYVLFLDWAAARCGLASFDVAVFMVQSFPSNKRRQVEKHWVMTHASIVATLGVENWADPWLDYRHGVLAWVIHSIQNATHRPGDLDWVVIERYVTAAVDLRVGELIQ